MVSISNNNLLLVYHCFLKKRVDAIVETDLIVQYEIEKSGKNNQFRHNGNTSKPMKVYIALSPNHSKYEEILADIMEDIRRYRELDIINKNTGDPINYRDFCL